MTIQTILEKFSQLKAERSNWESSWQKISEFVNTKKANFTTTQTEGEFLNSKVFNNTAQQALKNRASTIKSMLFGDYDYKFEPVDKLLNNNSLVEFLQKATEITKENLKKAYTGFNKSLGQAGEFDAGYGTSLIYADYDKHLNFKCLDLRECYIDEDYTGNVDTLFRSFSLDIRQAVQQFGLENISQNSQKLFKDGSRHKIDILNVIAPKIDYPEFDVELDNDFTYISVFIEVGENHLIAKQGYYERPFVAHREGQKVGEKYGRSPSFDAISAISQANAITKDMMLIVNRQADPPLGKYDDRAVLDTSPGSIVNFQSSQGSGNPVFNLINETGQPQVLAQYITQIEEKITKFYGIDRLLDFNSNQQMTATEVEARSKIRNSTLADLFQSEIDDKYNPLLERAFNLLFRNGYFDELLNQYQGDLMEILQSGEEVYKISYYNQISREKNTQNNNAILNVWITAGQISQMTQDLSIFDNLDADKTINLTKTLSYTNEIFRSQPEVSKLRKDREDKQVAAMATQGVIDGNKQ